jgi:hypothetical protein
LTQFEKGFPAKAGWQRKRRKKMSVNNPRTAADERASIALAMRAQGHSYRGIGEKIGISKTWAQKIMIAATCEQIPVDSRSITSLRIPKRIYDCLRNMGITEVEEVARLSAKKLLSLNNMGKKSVQQLEEALTLRGLRLATKFQYVGEPMCEEEWQGLLQYIGQLAELEAEHVAQ